MKRVGQKIVLWTLLLIGYGIMLGMPIYLLLDNLIIGQETKAVFSIMTAIILFALFLVISKWLIKVYNRKLQAIAVAEEIGVVPSTPFIVSRILKQLEIMLPIAVIGFILYGITFIQVPAYIVFRDILLWIAIGTIILLVHDGLKLFFTNINIIDRQIELEDKVLTTRERRAYRIEMNRDPEDTE